MISLEDLISPTEEEEQQIRACYAAPGKPVPRILRWVHYDRGMLLVETDTAAFLLPIAEDGFDRLFSLIRREFATDQIGNC